GSPLCPYTTFFRSWAGTGPCRRGGERPASASLPLHEPFDLLRPRLRIRLAHLDQAAQVVGLEHDHAERVGAEGLPGAERAGEEAERTRQAGLVVPGEAAQVAGRPEHEQVHD